MDFLLEKYNTQLKTLTGMVRENLEKMAKITVESLLVHHVHSKKNIEF
jgi:hypothetical protein